MKPTIDIYCGSPIEIDSERVFLGQLSADLLARGQPALVFANFFPSPNSHQIDFLVVTGCCACHVELKRLTSPVVGGINGRWSLKQPDGYLLELEAKNPYRQALDGKLAISDQMHAYARHDPAVPRPDRAKFYTRFESAVCVFPELLPRSSVFEDHKVRVRGYPALLELLLRRDLNPGWERSHWVGFAMYLGLVRSAGEGESVPADLAAACRAAEGYARRFADFHSRGLHRLIGVPVRCGAEVRGVDEFSDLLMRGTHAQLIGPSGCGKSHLATHTAVAAARAGSLPILARGRDYEGKLSSLLDLSVANSHPATALDLLGAAGRAGRPVALILDGFDECPRRLRQGLLKDLQALYLRHPMPVLITAQQAVDVPQELYFTRRRVTHFQRSGSRG